MVHFISVPVPTGHRRWRMQSALRSTLLTGTLIAALTAQAQPAAKPAGPNPLDANASVPKLSYESSFSQYRRLGDENPVSWLDANDTVTRIGGWRVYAREAQQPDPAPAAMPADGKTAASPRDAGASPKPNQSAKPMPAGHGGHKMP